MKRSLFIVLVWTLVGCETDPAQQQIEKFALAIASKDATTIVANHVLSSQQNDYCQSDEFERIVDQVRRGTTPQKCEKFSSSKPDEVSALDDEARLLFQIARMVCEDPNLDCVHYGQRVLTSQIPVDPLWGRVQGEPKILKVIREGDAPKAAAYIEFSAGSEKVVRALKIENINGKWLLMSGFPEGS